MSESSAPAIVTLAIPCRADEPALARTVALALDGWRAAERGERLEVLVCLNGAPPLGATGALAGMEAALGGPCAVLDVDRSPVALSPRSATFHGRDVFAPVAAALASGVSPDLVGTPCADMVRLTPPRPRDDGASLHGVVVGVDRFGNLATNLEASVLGSVRSIDVAGRAVAAPAPTYASVAPGALVAVVNSAGVLEIAIRDGSAATVLAAGVGTPITVVRG